MYLILKRFFDFIISFIAIVVVSPFMVPIIICLLITGEGYVFYRQERVGFKNRIFSIYKFSTMLRDSPNLPGGIITTINDPRITPMGGFLRKTKINELPQLINILIGDMSFVGPRPVMQKSFDSYPSHIQENIYSVKPGLTGIGSIIFRNEEQLITEIEKKNGDIWNFYKNKIYPFKGDLEMWYKKNISFFIDLKLILLTAWVIVFPHSKLIFKVLSNLPDKPCHLN